jgi:hypothetical protein
MTYPPDGFERRREPRLATSLDTIVEVTWYASVFKARTIDRSYHGVLLEFDSAPKIPIGDLVVLDLMAPDPNWKLRPYLGIGKVARIQGSRMGITLDLSDLISLPEAPSIREGLEVYG